MCPRARVPRVFAEGRSGFTLIEVLVALVILSTGIVLVLRAFETSLSALGRSRDTLLASLLLRQKIAEVDAALRRDAEWTDGSSESFGDGPYAGFRRRCEVSPAKVPGGTVGGGQGVLQEVKVTVFKETFGPQTVSTLVFVPALKEDSGTAASQGQQNTRATRRASER